MPSQRFIILFDEKEGTSPLVQLLDKFPQVAVVHQVDRQGWEPFDRHNCGPMSLSALETCLEEIFGADQIDIDRVNRTYGKTASRDLAFDTSAKIIGFKMRYASPSVAPVAGDVFGIVDSVRRLRRRRENVRFHRMMLSLLRRHDVVVLMAIRLDTLRWALSKYHGDGNCRPGHLQFRLASGALRRTDIGKFTVDLDVLGEVIDQCRQRQLEKQELVSAMQRCGIRAHLIVYEEFLTDKLGYFQKLFDYLGSPVEPAEVTSALAQGAYFQKVHSDDISEFVVNSADVIARFGTHSLTLDR
jgi:hypothetical protein